MDSECNQRKETGLKALKLNSTGAFQHVTHVTTNSSGAWFKQKVSPHGEAKVSQWIGSRLCESVMCIRLVLYEPNNNIPYQTGNSIKTLFLRNESTLQFPPTHIFSSHSYLK